ncbi:leucine-rich repeat transmembrane neuronal protein 2-like [Bradysia coprophila]|uniref:leucine-rich repeat transmembrane neuronal protein 2-like n=1 Tax=Bradysia coprophila TaxID=38358 RepID=UPI00187D9E6B|nr:leucine-rich repeat transmembrane neuronal protein 2-like [Bradysia coprophila]
MCCLIFNILLLFVWANSCSNALTVNVHCDEGVDSFCIVSDKLNINERVHFNFINADHWKYRRVFKISSDSRMALIPTGIFQQFPDLVRVYFPTGLKSVSKDDFEGASRLVELNLEHNEIESIVGDLFNNVKFLQSIFLSHNRINNIEASAFGELEDLNNLELTNNSLTVIKRNVFADLNTLSVLKLDNNRIETIEDGALDLPGLKELFLTNNRIQTLSDRIFSRSTHLKSINFNGNQMRSIGQSLYNLAELQRLHLDDNIIDDIDLDLLGRLPSLESIHLRNSGFKVSNVNSDLTANYNAVQFLDISKNRITANDILRRLKNFRNLVNIDLGQNDLTDIDDIEQVWNLFTNIRHVSITKNKLTCDRVQQIYEATKKHSAFSIGIPMPRLPQIGIEEKNVLGVVCL